LFDEIEKAHPEVFNLLLQMLDDGRLTDSQGRVVDFKNTVIIMTSNLGSEYILENNPDKFALINKELRSTFKPEFLNRIDEILYFNSLNKDVVYKILDKLILEINQRLKGRNIIIELSDKAKEKIINEAYDEAFGARPIKRFLSDNIETLIAIDLIEGKISDGSKVLVDFEGEKFVLRSI
jgi:ATP-dependent Clp protease ATP-binding subunit ClpB